MSAAQAASTITVVVADDHPLMLKGLVMALAEEPSLQIVGQAYDGADALTRIVELKPNVAVLDLDMPKLDGFEVTRKIAEMQLPTDVIILTLHNSVDMLCGALDLGIRGYILKSSAIVDIVGGVQRVALGGSFLSAGVQQALAQRAIGRPMRADVLLHLTPIELSIVKQIAAGESSREIAEALSLSTRTIENYRTKICNKLDLTGAHALTRFAVSNRWRIAAASHANQPF